jgi:hypothetical protein
MAKLPKGALRGVRKAMKAQGGPQKQVKAEYGAKSVQAMGSRPNRIRSYNVRIHDLVEYRPYDHSYVLMDWQIGQVVGINQTPTYSGVSETTYRILGPDGIGIQEILGRNVRMISRPEDA